MYLIRVDDFPRPQGKMDIEKFRQFHKILKNFDIPYLLAIIPKMGEDDRIPKSKTRMLTQEEIHTIRDMNNNVKFAMHGVFHRTIRKNYLSEFIDSDEKTIESKIRLGFKLFEKYGIKTSIYVPPFNTFDLSNLQVFKKYFRIITGGPETIKIFGKMPAGNLDGILYIPSYRPFYGQPEEIYRGVKKNIDKKDNEINCITFHWGWDIRNDFKYTEKICNVIKNDVISWNFSSLQTSLC